MKLKVNNKKIKLLREQHAWSQSQLAEMANLNIRTIQRIEAQGRASIESIRSLSSVFNVPHQALIIKEKALIPQVGKKIKAVMSVILTSILLAGGLVYKSAQAHELMISLDFESKDEPVQSIHLLNKAGETSEVVFSEKYKVLFTPKLVGKRTYDLTTKIYSLGTSKPVLIAAPSFSGELGKDIQVAFDTVNMSFKID